MLIELSQQEGIDSSGAWNALTRSGLSGGEVHGIMVVAA